jgi:hypothetical protein
MFFNLASLYDDKNHLISSCICDFLRESFILVDFNWSCRRTLVSIAQSFSLVKGWQEWHLVIGVVVLIEVMPN